MRRGAFSADVRMSIILDGVTHAVAQASDDFIILAPSTGAALRTPCSGVFVLSIDGDVQRSTITLLAPGVAQREYRATFAPAV